MSALFSPTHYTVDAMRFYVDDNDSVGRMYPANEAVMLVGFDNGRKKVRTSDWKLARCTDADLYTGARRSTQSRDAFADEDWP
jgi:hypothetical protein